MSEKLKDECDGKMGTEGKNDTKLERQEPNYADLSDRDLMLTFYSYLKINPEARRHGTD